MLALQQATGSPGPVDRPGDLPPPDKPVQVRGADPAVPDKVTVLPPQGAAARIEALGDRVDAHDPNVLGQVKVGGQLQTVRRPVAVHPEGGHLPHGMDPLVGPARPDHPDRAGRQAG